MTNTTQFKVTIKSTESGEVVLNEVYPSARVADKEMKAFLISQTDPADTESIRAIGETVRFTEYAWWSKDNHTKHLHCPFEVMMVPVLENAHYYRRSLRYDSNLNNVELTAEEFSKRYIENVYEVYRDSDMEKMIVGLECEYYGTVYSIVADPALKQSTIDEIRNRKYGVRYTAILDDGRKWDGCCHDDEDHTDGEIIESFNNTRPSHWSCKAVAIEDRRNVRESMKEHSVYADILKG
jgi:hypothetical protein